jgi:hypothetical protein
MSSSRSSKGPIENRYELRDRAGQVLGATGAYGEAVRMLQAYVIAWPDKASNVLIVSLADDGCEIARQDLVDIELAGWIAGRK